MVTPLYIAASNGHLAVVDSLLQVNSDVKSLFSCFGQIDALVYLLKEYKNTDKDFFKDEAQAKRIIDSLLKKGVDFFKQSYQHKNGQATGVLESPYDCLDVCQEPLRTELKKICDARRDNLVAYEACISCSKPVSLSDVACVMPCGHGEVHKLCAEKAFYEERICCVCNQWAVSVQKDFQANCIVQKIRENKKLQHQLNAMQEKLKVLTREKEELLEQLEQYSEKLGVARSAGEDTAIFAKRLKE